MVQYSRVNWRKKDSILLDLLFFIGRDGSIGREKQKNLDIIRYHIIGRITKERQYIFIPDVVII